MAKDAPAMNGIPNSSWPYIDAAIAWREIEFHRTAYINFLHNYAAGLDMGIDELTHKQRMLAFMDFIEKRLVR